MNTPTQRQTSVTRLRGLAALLVVFGHSFHPYALNQAQYLLNPAFLFISSATVLFVLISGMLFRAVAIPRIVDGKTGTQEILRRRWAELSGLYLTVGLFLAVVIGFAEGVREGPDALFHFVRMMLNGGMAQSYWYVPFFMLLMACTPLHVLFCRQKVSVQTGLVIAGLVVSAIIHRPDAYVLFGAVQSLVYYIPVFWIGLMIGANIPVLLDWLRNKELPLFVAVLCIIAIQTEIGQDQVYLTSFGERWGSVDLFVVQKVVFGLLFLSLFERTKQLEMPLIDWISRHSLIIFFMHCPILILMMWVPNLSGFFVPELVALTALMIVAGVQLHKSLIRVSQRVRPTDFANFASRV
ncbi:acyltransferase family protein [Roseovarius sp. B08]|uniref:acyltransferase family protein n=1 Tax=Roseovarius sp. B08 TaxID=3449223 RepID=UPI003EDBF0AA